MRNLGLTPREQKVLRAIEQRRNKSIDWIALAIAISLGLGVGVGVVAISKYIWGG
jgi:hypothetical protein